MVLEGFDAMKFIKDNKDYLSNDSIDAEFKYNNYSTTIDYIPRIKLDIEYDYGMKKNYILATINYTLLDDIPMINPLELKEIKGTFMLKNKAIWIRLENLMLRSIMNEDDVRFLNEISFKIRVDDITIVLNDEMCCNEPRL